MSSFAWKRAARAWPFLVLAGLAVLFALMLLFSRKAPFISRLEPAMAAPGDQVVVVGDYFGRTAREGSLSLAGEIPPPSLIQSWTDQKIVFVVPEDASSGLVSISNSQGTSPGVLFTNTETIPTVLQAVSAPGTPLLAAVLPPSPSAGQVVVLSGRGFGQGGSSSVEIVTNGPVLRLEPRDCLSWSDRSVSFRWPGLGPATVKVVTPRGTTGDLPLTSVSALAWEEPRTISVDITASAGASGNTVLWGLAPQALSGTAWKLVSSQPASSGLLFRWPASALGDRKAQYQLSLTTWTRRWLGVPAGSSSGFVPLSDSRPLEWWKPAQAPLKPLLAKWGLDTSDPWQKVQRIQAGLAAFQKTAGSGLPGLNRAPAAILASGTLDSWEAASLAAYASIQAGVPARLVTGLWAGDELVSRPWLEVWIPGTGWVPWDPIDGGPGNLDNRHFAFETEFDARVRLEPAARLLGPGAPFGQGEPAGEAVWTSQEPVVQWQFKRGK